MMYFTPPDSWVELHYDSCSEHSEDTPALSDITDLEKMLLEAQRESSSSSRTSSHCSRCVQTFSRDLCVQLDKELCDHSTHSGCSLFPPSPRYVQTPPLTSAASFNTHGIAQVKKIIIIIKIIA